MKNVLRDESGQSFALMLVLLVLVLVLVIGLVNDLGRVATAQTIAQDAADLAVQDAAKQIDVEHFAATQEIVLAPDAVHVAAYWADWMTEGRMQVTDLYTTLDGQIVLEGQVEIETDFLGMIGISKIYRRVVAVARPRYGIQQEGD